jgi:hypothetical protein
MELTDPSDEDEAAAELGSAVRQAIQNGCEAYRNGLSLVDISLDDVDMLTRVAEVRLTASVTVQVGYDSEGMTPEDWASEYGWNFLAFESSDVDFDYSVDDHDSGEDADWDSEDAVQDPRERMRRDVTANRHALADREAVIRRVRTILDSGNFAPQDQNVAIAALFDVELAHGLALDEYGDRLVAGMSSVNDPDSMRLTYGKGVIHMQASQFPRVMKKGVFKGRRFETGAEYQQAFKALRTDPNGYAPPKRKSPRKRVPTGTYRIEVQTDSMHLVVEGEIRGNVQDTLLNAIVTLPAS